MRRSTLAALSALALVAFLAPAAAAAQHPVVFSQIGWGKIMESDSPGGSIGFGVGLAYQFPMSNWGIGAEGSYMSLGSQDTPAGEASYNTMPITGQLYHWFPTTGTTHAYLDAGMGFYNTGVEVGSTDDSSTDFGFNFGGGLKFGSPTSSLKFGLDSKLHFISTEGESTNMLSIFGRIFFGS